MPHIVNEKCIKCKYTDCVEVCPVDCFYEGDDMLFINPDECIDCGVCIPECPVDAIVDGDAEYDGMKLDDIIDSKSDEGLTEAQKNVKKVAELNHFMSLRVNRITEKIDPLETAEEFKDKKDKFKYLESYFKVKEKKENG